MMEKNPKDDNKSKRSLDLQTFFQLMIERSQKNIMGSIWENEQSKLRKVYLLKLTKERHNKKLTLDHDTLHTKPDKED
jgi:hypothetical protein